MKQLLIFSGIALFTAGAIAGPIAGRWIVKTEVDQMTDAKTPIASVSNGREGFFLYQEADGKYVGGFGIASSTMSPQVCTSRK